MIENEASEMKTSKALGIASCILHIIALGGGFIAVTIWESMTTSQRRQLPILNWSSIVTASLIILILGIILSILSLKRSREGNRYGILGLILNSLPIAFFGCALLAISS
jgi:hypothetical protein